MNVSRLGRFELASRIALDETTGSWFVVGVEDAHIASLLGEDIESLVEHEVMHEIVTDRDSLVIASRAHTDHLVLFHALADLDALHLDDARSQLQRERAAVLLISPTQLGRLASLAPHFASWAGNRAFLVEEDRFLDEASQEKRLDALREHYRMSDQELIERVKRRALSSEPDYIEWLVLLGRQDLLGGDQ